MKQEIEFIKSLPKTSIQLPSQWMLMITIATFVCFISISIIMLIYQMHQYIALRSLLSKHTVALTESKKLSAQYPLLAISSSLINNLPIIEATLKEKQNYYISLSRTALRRGFSEYLLALADLVPNGLWLQKMIINQEEENFLLTGYMTDPVKISLLIQSMQNSQIFTKINFDLLDIKAVPKKTYTEFTVSNKPQSSVKEVHDN